MAEQVREFIQAMIESELETALARPRYGRRPTADVQNGNGPKGISGHRQAVSPLAPALPFAAAGR